MPSLSVPTKKRCSTCKTPKLLDSFHRNKSRPDGLSHHCKECDRKRAARFRRTDKGRLYHRDACRKYRARMNGSDASRARAAVSKATAEGTILRAKDLPCADCGKRAQQYHHHLGYAWKNRLKIVALCILCHRKADKLMDRAKPERDGRPLGRGNGARIVDGDHG
jgi:hypothetical protein